MIVHGSVSVSGDKSLTHRLLLLAGLSPGTSSLRGALTSLDSRSTATVLRRLGVAVSPLRAGTTVAIQGSPRFAPPREILHCGNSGTTARLTLGLLAGHLFSATLTGDRSLRGRPMRRVSEPLAAMGARFTPAAADRLPLEIRGGALRPLRWPLPVSSAQLKGCLLFAGVAGSVEVAVREPTGRSRDHTERLLRAFGFLVEEDADGWIRFAPTGALQPFDLTVPGDPSSAAFLVAAGVLAESGSLELTGVGLNPTRTGFLRVLDRMGARVSVVSRGERCGEPVGDLRVTPGPLRSTTVAAEEIPALIDEVPVLAVLASRARGITRFHDVGELRVKESDRLALLAENLRAVGGRAVAEHDILTVEGVADPPRGSVRTAADHRIAMAFQILNVVEDASVVVDNLRCAAVSFPGFEAALRSVTASRKGRIA
jgi:3-phosphoshikimate 1-carboxyvinyltransferase